MSIVTTNVGTASITVQGPTVSLTVGGSGTPFGCNIYVLVTEFSINVAVPTNGSVTDSLGNVYTALSGVTDSGNNRYQVFECHSARALSSVNTITYTLVGGGLNNVAAMSVFYATGLITSTSALDAPTVATKTFSGSNPAANTSGAPTFAGELFLAMAGWVGSSTTFTLDTGNGWAAPPPTQIQANAAAFPSFFYGVAGGLQFNPVGTQKTTQPTFGTPSNGATIVLALLPFVPAKPIFKPLRTYLRR